MWDVRYELWVSCPEIGLHKNERARQMVEPRNIHRYSHAFKQKVVSEIENGNLTLTRARELYGIGGCGTIQTWLRKLGKAHLLNKVIHIEMKNEQDKLKELERQKRALESALAQAQLKIIALESTIKVLEEEAGVKVKKSIDTASSKDVSTTSDSTKDTTP